MIDDKALATQKTAARLVETYIAASDIIEAAYDQLEKARLMLEEDFGESAYMDVTPRAHTMKPKAAYESVMGDLKKRAWRRILAITQINKMLSIKRAEEMDERLESGDLPEIALDEVLSMLHSLADNTGNFVKEAAKEVFDVLRPGRGQWGSKLKTNQKNGRYNLGEKVILMGYIENQFGGGYRLSYWREKDLVAVDRVFHALDSNLKGMDSSYRGPLADAIGTTQTGGGETEYFSFKCFRNGNLHLWFKRMDLVQKLNAINGDSSALKG